MESAGIDDLIVNSTALSFLLNLDEMILAAVNCDSLSHLLESCDRFEISRIDAELQDEMMDRTPSKVMGGTHHRRSNKIDTETAPLSRLDRLINISPTHLIFVFLMTCAWISFYYIKHCDSVDGRWISKPLHVPKTLTFTSLNSLFPYFFPVPREQEPSWIMPSK
jgi:hypothetical protein